VPQGTGQPPSPALTSSTEERHTGEGSWGGWCFLVAHVPEHL
jgi:hypothetical protein